MVSPDICHTCYLAKPSSGKSVILQMCKSVIRYLANLLPGKSVIWRIRYLANMSYGKYVICGAALWKSCYMVNLDILHTSYLALPSSDKSAILQTCRSLIRYLAILFSGKCVMWHTCNMASMSSANLCFQKGGIWQTCVLGKVVCGYPGYLDFLLSGKAVTGASVLSSRPVITLRYVFWCCGQLIQCSFAGFV